MPLGMNAIPADEECEGRGQGEDGVQSGHEGFRVSRVSPIAERSRVDIGEEKHPGGCENGCAGSQAEEPPSRAGMEGPDDGLEMDDAGDEVEGRPEQGGAPSQGVQEQEGASEVDDGDGGGRGDHGDRHQPGCADGEVKKAGRESTEPATPGTFREVQ